MVNLRFTTSDNVSVIRDYQNLLAGFGLEVYKFRSLEEVINVEEWKGGIVEE